MSYLSRPYWLFFSRQFFQSLLDFLIFSSLIYSAFFFLRNMSFYIVHTYTGKEKKVKESLERKIAELGLQNLIRQVILPSERVLRVKKSELIPEERKLYPGYIIVEMDESEEAFNLVNSTPGVTQFLGTRTKPLPLAEEEVKEILEQIEKGRQRVTPEAPFTKGEMVKVISGPFAGFTGTVEEIFPERRRVRVTVTIFGRLTPVELDFVEVQTI